MYELTQLGAQTYFIHASTNVGVYVCGSDAYLIDSGLTPDDAENFLRVLQEQGWTLRAVLNTHYHADHVGGNRTLQDKSHCRLYCSQPYFAQFSVMNPSFMFGAYPPKPLRGPMFLAEASGTELLTSEVLPEGLEMVPLHGHAYEQFAFRTPDDVLFTADAVLGEQELQHYRLSYLYRLDQYLESLDRLEEMTARWFVPSHAAEAVADIRPLTALNRDSCQQICAWILDLCAGDGMNQDLLLKNIFDRVHRHMHLAQYALSSCTLHAYLGYLIDQGTLIARAKENLLCFRTL